MGSRLNYLDTPAGSTDKFTVEHTHTHTFCLGFFSACLAAPHRVFLYLSAILCLSQTIFLFLIPSSFFSSHLFSFLISSAK